MSRILFAAARGARLDRLGHITGTWIPDGANYEAIQRFPNDFRIHPEDEHLAYGPISTALRDAATKPPVYPGMLGYPAWGHVCEDMKDWIPHIKRNGRAYYEHVEELHRSLFLLILAEALADSGL